VDPNDDEEYMLVGRSDGLLLVHATPMIAPGAGVTTASIPANRYYDWLVDDGWAYLGPASGQPAPPNPPPSGPDSLNCNLHYFLNGDFNPMANCVNGAVNLSQAYCSVPGGGAQSSEYHYTSNDTTNREVTALYDATYDRFFVFSVNAQRPGIWVVEVSRVSSGPNAGLLRFTPNSDYWYDTSVSSQAPGECHMIYVDTSREQLFVTDDSNGRVRAYQVAPNGPALLTSILSRSGSAHDAMPVGDLLFVGYQGIGLVEVFDLDHLSWPPTQVTIPSTNTVHSVYYHDAPSVASKLWVISEQTNPNVVQVDGAFPPPGPGEGGGAFAAEEERIVSHVEANGVMQAPASHFAHNLRGLGRTGYIAHYVDGISVVDLNDSGSPMVALASYDTSGLARSVVGVGSFCQSGLDIFLGAWDVFPAADSGVIYVSAGGSPSPASPGVDLYIGAVAFRVEVGHLNRFYGSTPFGAPSAAAGLAPRLVNPYGPPREGRPFILIDESAGSYPDQNGGQSVGYRYTLIYSSTEPSLVSAPQWSPDFSVFGSSASAGVGGEVALNLVASPANTWVIQNPIDNPTFVFPTVGVEGDRWFFQLIVEEMDRGTDPPAATGRFAASRGHWMGVAR